MCWATQPDGGGKTFSGGYFMNDDKNDFSGAKDLYAIWEELEDCTITFNFKEGSPAKESVTVKTGASVTLPDRTVPGKKLVAWLLKGSSVGAPGATYTAPETSVELEAQWELADDMVQVIFEAGDGTLISSESSISVARGSSITLPDVTPPGGKWLVGWYGSPSYAGTAGDSFTVDTTEDSITLTDEYDLRMVFDPVTGKYIVSFNVGRLDTPGLVNPKSITGNSAITLPGIDTVNDGDFAWFDENDQYVGSAGDPYTPSGDVTLTAKGTLAN